jgi:excisionase family DNA binding protein
MNLPTVDRDQNLTPIVVSPAIACQLLSVGLTRLYEILRAGELDSYRDGASRRITTESIRGYVTRRLAAERTAA